MTVPAHRAPPPGAPPAPVRVGLFGCGSFGRHHARVYAQSPRAHLVGIHDRDSAAARAVAAAHGVPVFDDPAALAAEIEAASVAVPTAFHAALTLDLLRQGKDVLVEKPIAASLAEADAMTAAAAAAGRILQVGHLERFNPAVRLVRPRITRPLFFEVHRLSLFSPRSLDVDVLLDLMIHDLDIVLSFLSLGGAAPEIEDVRAVGLPVLSRKEDIANVRLGFANGCVANFTASRVSTEKVRKLRLFQPGEYVSLDYTRQDAHVFALAGAGASPASGPADIRSAMAAIIPSHLTAPPAEPLAVEIEAFLAGVRSRQPPECGGAEGRAALAAALRAGQAIARHARRVGLG
ncbi:MAG: Gfo/Idh/MocA family protein [Terriglobales bacterium]